MGDTPAENGRRNGNERKNKAAHPLQTEPRGGNRQVKKKKKQAQTDQKNFWIDCGTERG